VVTRQQSALITQRLIHAGVVNHCERNLIIRLYHLEKFSHQIKLELLLSLVALFTMDNVAVPMKVEALACMTFKNLKILKSSKRLMKQVSDINPALDQAMNGLSNSLASNSLNIVLESKTRGQAMAHQSLFRMLCIR
jgi:hypothetical protein